MVGRVDLRALLLGVVVAACGGKVTDSRETGSFGAPDPMATGGVTTRPRSVTGGTASTGGRTATGGAVAWGGTGASFEPPTGGAVAAGGRPPPPPPRLPPPPPRLPPPPPPPPTLDPPPPDGPDLSRYVPYLCWDPCKTPSDCPSPDPYIGTCGPLSSACIFRCDAGCPPDTEMLHINGGCLCYHPDINASAGPSECCSRGDCGAPYYVPCCDGLSCIDGTCR